jgi:hypothetical protein
MTVEDVYEAIAAHLAYLDRNAADYTAAAKRRAQPFRTEMGIAAGVYAEVAAELRNTLGLEQP